MTKALILSILLHFGLFAGLIWSAKFSAAMMRANIEKLNAVGVKKAEELYKPTEVNIRYGEVRSDLPPPKIKRTTQPKIDAPIYVKPQKEPPKKNLKQAKQEKKEQKKKEELQEKKQSALALIDKFREDDGLDAKEKPRDDNFPTRLDGEKDATGTGGSTDLQATAAQLALQSAMRKYFELPQASQLRKQNPDAIGYLAVTLIGIGRNLQVRSIETIQSSGFQILDVSCERAVRRALREETFAADVVSELSGQETTITCQF